jgi:hypothetical protein
MMRKTKTSRRRSASLAVTPLEPRCLLSIAANWLGQDNHDLTGLTHAPAADGKQDVHIQLSGLPSGTTINYIDIKEIDGAGEWQFNGSAPLVEGAAIVPNEAGPNTAGLYFQPDSSFLNLNGTPQAHQIAMTVAFADGTAQMITLPGTYNADPTLHTNTVTGTWLGQDGSDLTSRAASGVSVSDGLLDTHLVLNNLPAGLAIAKVDVHDDAVPADDYQYNGAANVPSVALVNRAGGGAADLYIQYDQAATYITDPARTLDVNVTYTDGTHSVLTIGGVYNDPNLRTNGPGSPNNVTATARGQDGSDLVGDGATTAPDGLQDQHLTLAGLPTNQAITQVDVYAYGGGHFQYTAPGFAGTAAPHVAAVATSGQLWRAALVRSGNSSTADLYVQDNRAEDGSSSAHYDIYVTYADGSHSLVTASNVTNNPSLPTAVPTNVIDDMQAGYAEAGSWQSAGPGGDNGEYRFAAPGNGNASATWQYTGLTAASYDVQATWMPYWNRADDAHYLIYDGNTLVKDVRVNQQLAPSGPSTGGVTFMDLGPVRVASGTLRVVLSNDADGYVVADAVNVSLVTSAPSLLDNNEPGYTESGTWTWAGHGGYDGEYRFAAPSANGVATSTVTWTSSNLFQGNYDVQVTWVPYANRADDAHYLIYDGTTLVKDVRVNQQLAPVGPSYGGVTFMDLGPVHSSSGTLRVVLGNDADGTVVADAVRVLPVASASSLVDDNEAGYAETGAWTGAGGGGYDGGYRFAAPSAGGAATSTATWTSTGLASGTYDVQATWVPYGNRADNAHYLIYDGNTLVKSLFINQQLMPVGSNYGGTVFQDLGKVSVTSGTLRIVLGNDADGTVVADAVRVVPA